MPRTTPPLGAPCWFELASNDPDASANFHHALFGWSQVDMDLGPMGIYSFLRNGNGTVGALCSLPPGAPFCLWQSRNPDAGDFVMFEDHAIGWVELASRDALAARDFYVGLLGWECDASPVPIPGGVQYFEYGVGGTRYGGILPMTAEWGEMPSHWSIYVLVPDADACAARATELGGKVCVPAFDAPGVGRIARIDDPTGAGAYVIRLLRS